MNRLEIGGNTNNAKKIIDVIGIIVFAVLIIFWCDLDIQGWLVFWNMNTNIRLGLLLCCIVIIGILTYKYVSRNLGILVFVLTFLITEAMLGYTELFTTTTTMPEPTLLQPTNTTNSTNNNNQIPLSELSNSADEVQQFLLKQIADDPNTTTVDKRVISDLIDRYFKSSNKLAELRDFNIASESANILPGQQIIVGLDTIRNQH